jgi:outer membrane protein OmpA-like peptidoglycan-associated protein
MSVHTQSRSGSRPGPHLLSRWAGWIGLTAVLVLASGCASKGYVRQHVAEAEAAMSARLNSLDGEVAATRTLAGEAMDKATLAEKLATGALDYQVVSTHDTRFAFDDSGLDGEAIAVLDDLATRLAALPRGVIELRGFADASGEDRYNYRLGRERAEAVERYLVARRGIPAGRVAVLSMGEEDPVADNATREGRAENRRVTARLLEIVPRPGDTPMAFMP